MKEIGFGAAWLGAAWRGEAGHGVYDQRNSGTPQTRRRKP